MITRLYIEGQQIDLSEDIVIPLNFNVDNIRDISKINSSYSKTITVPGTANNNKAFNFLFDVKAVGNTSNTNTPNIGRYYDFKKKAKCYVLENNIVVMSGYTQLVSATKTNGVISYEIQIVSELTNFASVIADKMLSDISGDLTDQFTHTLTRSKIRSSWEDQDENPATGVIYPLIDYAGGYNDGWETVNGKNWYLSAFRPALFLKQYIDLIFANSNFTYSSDFLNSEYFKRLVFPWVDKEFSAVGGNSMQATSCDDFSCLGIDHNADYADAAIGKHYPFKCLIEDNWEIGSYNASGATFTAPVSAYYDTSVSIPAMQFYFTSPWIDAIINTAQRVWIVYEKYTADFSSSSIVAKWKYDFEEKDIFYNNSSPFTPIFTTITPAPTLGYAYEYTSKTFELNADIMRIKLEEGQHLKVSIYLASKEVEDDQLFIKGSLARNPGTTTLVIKEETPPILKIAVSSIFDNSRVTYQDFVPKSIKQIDLIASTFKLFNLIIVPDPDKLRHFNIYEREEFYNSGKIVDWTDKVCYDEEVKVTPLPNLSSSALNFSYKEDKDYFNSLYTSSTGLIYGSYKIDTGFELNDEVKNVFDKTIFSPTISIQYKDTAYPCESMFEVMTSNKKMIYVSGFNKIEGDELPSSGAFIKAKEGVSIFFNGVAYRITNVVNPYQFEVIDDLPGTDDGGYWIKNGTFSYFTSGMDTKIIPVMYDSNDQLVTRSPLKCNPRILYYSGLKDCEQWYIQDTPWLIGKQYTYASSVYFSTHIKYPMLSHLDDVDNPTRDLLFGKPKLVYFNIESYPNYYDQSTGIYAEGFVNLYREWRNSVNEIIDNEAKLLSCKVRLNSIDIADPTLLANTINISGTRYRINKIIDYSPGTDKTSVELVRLSKTDYDPVPLPPPEPSCRSYRAHNYSTLYAQTINYYDCDGVLKAVTVTPHNEVIFCAYEDSFTKPQYVSITDDGDCGSVFYCRQFTVENTGGTSVVLTYTNCSGEEKTVTINADISKSFCAMQNSFVYEGDTLDINEVGACLPNCRSYKLTNTSSTFGLTATYKNCDNELEIENVDAGDNSFICALEGSIQVSSPDLQVELQILSCSFGEAVIRAFNNSSGSATITNVYTNILGDEGGSFPVNNGNETSVTTTSTGTRTVHVTVNKDGVNRSVTVIGSDGVSQCQNVTGSGSQTLNFTNVEITEWVDVQVYYNSSSCP